MPARPGYLSQPQTEKERVKPKIRIRGVGRSGGPNDTSNTLIPVEVRPLKVAQGAKAKVLIRVGLCLDPGYF